MYISENKLFETAQKLKNNQINAKEYIESIFEIFNKNETFVKAFLPKKNRKQRIMNEVDILLEKYPNSADRPSLFCVLVGIKDIVIVDGFETRCGSNLPAKIFEGEQAPFVTKLQEAGAIIFGKTVTTEFAYFEPGKTRNPHNINHTPGGSSSGSAAAVSAGFVPLAIGTQTIGSIVRPATFCGIVGFKPSFDRIDKSNVVPFSISADHIGIFTQDIEGAELTASILCENWQKEISSKQKIKIGVLKGSYIEQADNEVKDFYQEKISFLKNKGFDVVELNLFGDISKINKTHGKMTSAEFAEVHEEWFDKYPEKYRKKTAELILEGKKITMGELSEARIGRAKFRQKIENVKSENNIDIWITPSSPTPAPEGMATGSPSMNLPWTYSGLPVVTINAGFAKNELPLGLQFTGSFYKDEELLNIVKEHFVSLFKI